MTVAQRGFLGSASLQSTCPFLTFFLPDDVLQAVLPAAAATHPSVANANASAVVVNKRVI